MTVVADPSFVRVEVRDDGSGLGLAIARSLAVKQGGALDYVDRAFVLTLPMGRVRLDEADGSPHRTILTGADA